LQELRGDDDNIGLGIKDVMNAVRTAKNDTNNAEDVEEAPSRFAEIIDQAIRESRD
jgi:hypothetical protein